MDMAVAMARLTDDAGGLVVHMAAGDDGTAFGSNAYIYGVYVQVTHAVSLFRCVCSPSIHKDTAKRQLLGGG